MSYHEISELVLMAFSVGLSWFCFSLSGKIKKLNDLETGLGGAIAIMIGEVERLERAVIDAKAEAAVAKDTLTDEILRAKQERSVWAMQRNFAPPLAKEGKNLTRKRQPKSEAANEK